MWIPHLAIVCQYTTPNNFNWCQIFSLPQVDLSIDMEPMGNYSPKSYNQTINISF